MKRFFSFAIATVLLPLSFTGCSAKNNIFDKIDVVGDTYSVDGLVIGESTFEDTEKVYPDVDIESFGITENQSIPFFETDCTMEVFEEEIDMKIKYDFLSEDENFIYKKEDGEYDYSKLNLDFFEYEYYKDYISTTAFIKSDDIYDLEKASKILDELIAMASKKFGEPKDIEIPSKTTNPLAPIKVATWEQSNNMTLQIGTFSPKTDDYQVAIYIYEIVK